jgi:hypothetical protein
LIEYVSRRYAEVNAGKGDGVVEGGKVVIIGGVACQPAEKKYKECLH